MSDTRCSERERLLELLRRWGWNSTSFQALEPDFEYWFETGDDARDEACVAFLDTGSALVVAGSPICDPSHLAGVTERFLSYGRRRRRRVSFFGVESRFLDLVDLRHLALGLQPWWIADDWSVIVWSRRSLREQLRRARAKGVRVERVAPSDLEEPESDLRRDLGALIGRWLASRPMPPMAFLVELEPFAFAEERRYWIARRGDSLVGFLVAVPVYARNGWLFEDLLRDPAAPNGTAELLIDAAMRDLAETPKTWVTLGLAPLAGDARWQRAARWAMSGFYHFDGVREFKAKLRPSGWEPIHLAWPRRGIGLGALYDGLSAFARGRPFSFALRAIARMPPVALHALAALLAAWTVALAFANPLHWFPSRWVHLGWIAFDAVMAVSLWRLGRRWKRWLGFAVAAAMTFDAVASVVQLVGFNLARGPRASEWIPILAGVAGPAVVASFLWSRVRLER